MNHDLYIKACQNIDDVIINLVGLRQDMELLPYPTVTHILTCALDALKKSRAQYVNAVHGVEGVFNADNNKFEG